MISLAGKVDHSMAEQCCARLSNLLKNVGLFQADRVLDDHLLALVVGGGLLVLGNPLDVPLGGCHWV